jgi:hypothetical protein
MRSGRCAVAALLAVLLWPAPVEAYEPVDAKPLIDACWAISAAQRASGVTATMRKGAAQSVGCLEKMIIEQVRVMFDEIILTPAQAQEWLDMLRLGIRKLYWAIYNSHRGCDPTCGTKDPLIDLTAHGDVLEQMIRVMADTRNEYSIEPKE